jgi:hypothetical protein
MIFIMVRMNRVQIQAAVQTRSRRMHRHSFAPLPKLSLPCVIGQVTGDETKRGVIKEWPQFADQKWHFAPHTPSILSRLKPSGTHHCMAHHIILLTTSPLPHRASKAKKADTKVPLRTTVKHGSNHSRTSCYAPQSNMSNIRRTC